MSELYGADAAKTWLSSYGTKIAFRMTASASAAMICSELIGKRRVSWTTKNKSYAPWRWDGSGGGTTRSRQTDSQEIDVVTPSFLENGLGWFEAWPTPVIKGLVLGFGSDDNGYVMKLEWAIEPWPTLRPATIPAAWTKI